MKRNERNNLRSWAAALLLSSLSATTMMAAGITKTHRIEVQDGAKSVALLQRFVPVTKGYDVYLIAEGPVTGSKTAAIMRSSGTIEFYGGADKSQYWDSFFSNNGMDTRGVMEVRTEGKRKLADLYVRDSGRSSLVTIAYLDPDNPWGPCPGPNDAPTCLPAGILIPWICKFDVDQCSGGALPWPFHDAAGIDPDGDPARGLGLFQLSLDATTAINPASLGTTILPMDRRGLEHR